jgi:serine/threonine protein kinase
MNRDRFQLTGQTLDGKFRVDRIVAEGGFAVVYAGQHLNLDRGIAIKVLKTPKELSEGAIENFIAKFTLEAKTIARLNHLNIVQVIDSGVSRMPSGETEPWMVLEWLTGRTLERDLQQRRGHGGRTAAEALSLLEPIFDALSYAHEEGVAHRDVKPANIMIVSTKRGEMLKLLDFGILKIMEKGEVADKELAPTRGALSAHSPAYAAPEQITGLRTGPWTDVHGLGLLVTEVLTDLPPYEGKDITTLLREILSPQRPTPARRLVDAGPWEPVLAKALALDPSERFKDANEFLAALKSAISLSPPPLPLPRRLQVPTRMMPNDAGNPTRPSGKPVRSAPRRSPLVWLSSAAGVLIFATAGGYLALSKAERGKQPAQSKPVAPAQAATKSEPARGVQSEFPPRIDITREPEITSDEIDWVDEPAPSPGTRKPPSSTPVGRERSLGDAPTRKPASADRPAPNHPARSGNKPLQRTDIELE